MDAWLFAGAALLLALTPGPGILAFVAPEAVAAAQSILLGSFCVAANFLVGLAVGLAVAPVVDLGVGRLRTGLSEWLGLPVRLRLTRSGAMVALGLGALFLRRPA